MKKDFSKIGLGLFSLLSIFGINLSTSSASVPNGAMDIKADSPLYLEHASDIIKQNAQENTLLTWHYSHESHGSHGSHGSHESHYSHYSSRY